MEKHSRNILDKIESIQVQKTSDLVLEKIRGLIMDGTLAPGDRLPPERDLSSKFKVGRGHVREAIKKLEFYGILKTYPQSGTVVASHGVPLLENMISNLIRLDKNDKLALVEVREILEVHAAELAAERISDEQAALLQKALHDHYEVVKKGQSGLNEDLVFHLKVAQFSGNALIHSMVMLITPEVNNLSEETNSCRNGRAYDAWLEHKALSEAILAHDAKSAGEKMKLHLKNSGISFNI